MTTHNYHLICIEYDAIEDVHTAYIGDGYADAGHAETVYKVIASQREADELPDYTPYDLVCFLRDNSATIIAPGDTPARKE